MASNPNTNGVPGGSPVVTQTGNSFLDGLANISNVLTGIGSNVLNTYGSFLERQSAINLNNQQAAATAQQTNAAGINVFGTTTDDLQRYMLYGASALLLGVTVYYALKKA